MGKKTNGLVVLAIFGIGGYLLLRNKAGAITTTDKNTKPANDVPPPTKPNGGSAGPTSATMLPIPVNVGPIVIKIPDSPITVYSGANYTGNSAKLNEGPYNLQDLIKLGILNDTISSIKVAPGYVVTLFSDENFVGESKVLDKSSPDFSQLFFSPTRPVNDTFSSLIIESQSSKTPVVVYTDDNYSGKSAVLQVGKYDVQDLINLGIGNDTISSIRVAPGYRALLYKDAGFATNAFGDNRLNITTSDPHLGDNKFLSEYATGSNLAKNKGNDTISSIEVVKLKK